MKIQKIARRYCNILEILKEKELTQTLIHIDKQTTNRKLFLDMQVYFP